MKQKRSVKGLLLAVFLACAGNVVAKDVMCLKTNTGQYIEVVRVSMLVIPDGGSTFEIVVRDGEGATGVESVSFETHTSDIDLSKYQGGSSGESSTIDVSKPMWLITNTGRHFLVKDVSMLASIDSQGVFEVVTTTGNETGVTSVSFFRGPEAEMPTGIQTVKEVRNVESLRLLTPVSSQLSLSGCGDANVATVYGMDGQQMAEAPVSNGSTTVIVSHLKSGVYIVKVGNKALKFIKK
jgi:hypothetical protein